ncbi:hypothetical protein AB0O52_23150 [Arthrobacter sp. NPDC080073]|uniref:hypothetical protein n=1 Tax=Arthrobacter sp. NPDC080073 TaxID=3155919 RepID=UPI00343FA573
MPQRNSSRTGTAQVPTTEGALPHDYGGEIYKFIVGVDTHSRTHTFALMAACTGGIEETKTFPASEAGISRAVTWIRRAAGPELSVIVAIEGTGSVLRRRPDQGTLQARTAGG